ncbi:hypothetical protein BKN14_03230 [Candidatus Gracilibacteria bacterium HOT-871]|nr:hypothetical protein BKN14_03230 [Candidatus Gracilibacteria bacterium HOT-871]MBF0913480.1 ribosome-binding factor A [Candidatus Gracilibacteria bacterium]RKW22428.1 MAG: ribosome-binding factor A [Candidatus Gracilibacteria bacterium]
MNKDRLKKLEATSHKVLSDIIFEETSEIGTDFGLITITEIEISPDLSYLDVWVSAFKNEDILAKTLAKKNHIIQSRYNKTINIRKLPKIRYRYDNKGKIGQTICETINEITK